MESFGIALYGRQSPWRITPRIENDSNDFVDWKKYEAKSKATDNSITMAYSGHTDETVRVNNDDAFQMWLANIAHPPTMPSKTTSDEYMRKRRISQFHIYIPCYPLLQNIVCLCINFISFICIWLRSLDKVSLALQWFSIVIIDIISCHRRRNYRSL